MNFKFAPSVVALAMVMLATSCQKVMYVAPRKVECLGVPEKKCFLLRDKPDENWIMHYGRIDNLDYEEGFQYKVKLVKSGHGSDIRNSATNYRVVSVLEKKEVLPPGERLTSNAWRLTAFENVEGTRVPVTSEKMVLRFNTEEKKVNGDAGCNRFFGSYLLDDDNLSFKELGSTKMACPKEAMERETLFLSSLDQAIRFNFEGEVLRIVSGNDIDLIFELQQ
jgi:heat shock protein HslJ